MERTRHRRSKSVSGIEGTRQVKKQNAISGLSPASQSYADENSWNNMFFGQVNGMPMKKLLAEEMSIEVETKRRSPSVIARLMGLEVMPPPGNVHVRRQPKRSLSSQRQGVSVHFQENGQQHDGRLSRRSSTDRREYKDVYEDLEASHVLNHQRSSKWHGNSSLTRPKLPLNQQKFTDVNHFSTDQQLQDLEELYRTPGMSVSDHDFLLQFIQQPNSMSVNNLHDRQIDSGGSLGWQIAVLKPLNSVRCETKAKSRRPQGEVVKKHNVTSPRMREDGLLLEPYNCHRVHTPSYSSKSRSDAKNEMYKLPTKVVILKPNPVKTGEYDDGASLSSSHGYHQSKKTNGVGSSMPISTKARRIARVITTKMRNGSDAIKGYAGDESSCDGTGSDSESESEVFKPFSRMTLNDHNLFRYPCSHRGQTSVIGEAKKQISERWKMTHYYQDVEMSGNSNTLGEMLSLSERETRRRLLNGKMGLGGPSDRVGYNGHHPVMRDRPSDFGTRSAWKEEIVKELSRSMSLPPSSDYQRPSKMSTFDHDMIEDKVMIHSGNVCHGRSNSLEENRKEHNSPEDSKCRGTKRCPDQQMFINEASTSSEASFQIQIEKKNIDDQKSICDIATEEDMRKNLELDAMLIPKLENRNTSESPNSYSKPLSSVVYSQKSSTDDTNDSALQCLQELSEQGSSSLQCFETDPDPSENSRDADHSSPVSVLEAPSTEDAPSSIESFARVSAELHELRMQLQLLKMESTGGCTDEPFIEEEEPPMQPSQTPSERYHSLEESPGWEVSYTNDILNDSVMSHTTWHSPESPLDPKLFDFLEIKYRNNSTRSERRLLFDRVNSAVLQIFGEHEDSLLMPKMGMKLKRRKEDVIEKLMKEEEIGRDGDDEGYEMVQQLWEESKSEMVEIGNEIEKLMIDDIILEVMCY